MRPATAKSLPASTLCEWLHRESPGCTWLLRPDQSFEAVYGSAARLFGRAPGDWDHLKFAELFAPALRQAWSGRVARAFAGETLCATGRFHEQGPAYEITLFPVHAPDGGVLFAGGLAHEITDREALLATLAGLESDRARLSRLLHDQIGPQLSAAGMQLDLLRMDLAEKAPAPSARAAEVQATLENVIGLLREFGRDLCPPPERIGVRAALDRLAGNLRGSFRGNVRVLADGTAQPSPEMASALCRIAQEAAANAARHADCSTIEILLKSMRSGPTLEIRDDGLGFNPADGAARGRGLGLLIMRHYADRAGIDLQIESVPGKGTVVRAVCPGGRIARHAG